MKNDIKILMCGSDLSVKGGMVSVIKNYLRYANWREYNITYVPTHIEKNKSIVALYFAIAYVKILISALKGNFQILYLHTAERGSFYRKAIILRTLKRFGIKSVLHHHAAEFEQFYAGLSDKNKQFVNETLEMADLNIVLSKRLIPMITNKSPNAKVRVLYNAVSTYESNPYNKCSRNILFLGRLGERKGTYDLLKAIKDLDDKLPSDIHFYLCGDGEIENVKARVEEYGIINRIEHIGWIDGKQKEEFMSNTMINVLPSYNEGLPMSILETMAYGIPNISTNIASIPEVIRTGENGFLMNPGDVEQLRKFILLLCEDNELRFKVSHRSWQEIRDKFTLEAHIDRLIQYLAEF